MSNNFFINLIIFSVTRAVGIICIMWCAAQIFSALDKIPMMVESYLYKQDPTEIRAKYKLVN